MSHELTDEELLNELQSRFNENKQALHDLKAVTRKLEHVNKRLQESEQVKSDFLSNIRNEINNPLASIMALADQFSGQPENDLETTANVAKMIFAEASDLNYQLRNIFVAAEIEAGEMRVNGANVDIMQLLSSTVESFRHLTEPKQLLVNLSCDKHDNNVTHFPTDAEMLQVVFSNLFVNAIEYSPDGQTITINACREENLLKISIADAGPGVTEEEREIIFDRFKQLAMGTRKTHRGHGLGLSITKAIVDMLTGDIQLEQNTPHGCIFSIILPEIQIDDDMGMFSGDGNEFFFDGDGDGDDFGESETF